MTPPCADTIHAAIDKPSPNPDAGVYGLASSTRKYRSNTWSTDFLTVDAHAPGIRARQHQ
jgi:hypothetical protein